MFAKLLKHEFRTVGRSLFPVSIAALLSAVFGYFITLIATSNIELNNYSAIDSLAGILQGSIYLFLIIYAVGCSISLYLRFYRTKFTDEGYLTFTLPASTHQILLSSILNMVIWFVIILVVVFVSVILLAAPLLARLDDLIYHIQEPVASSKPPIGVTLVNILEAICTMCYGLILPLLAITLGSLLAKKHKLLAAFGIGYAINLAVSLISGILMIQEMSSTVMLYEDYYISVSTIISSLLSLALAVAGYFVMHHMIKNKLNI